MRPPADSPRRSGTFSASSGTEYRRPPAYQVYAADELAGAGYYTLSLVERGLVDSMRRVIWCDGGIPKDPGGIALAIRRPEPEVRDALTPGVLRQFQGVDGDPYRLTCAELRRQIARLLDRRRKQSAAADKTNSAKRNSKRSAQRDAKRNDKGGASEQNRTEPNPSLGQRVALGSVSPEEEADYVRAFAATDPPGQTTAASHRQASGR